MTPNCGGDTLNKWLQVYIAETRSKTGQPYPPNTLYSLLTGILRSMTAQNPRYPNFLEKKSVVFVGIHHCIVSATTELLPIPVWFSVLWLHIQCVPGTSKPEGLRLRSRSETKTHTQHVHVIVLTLLFFCAGQTSKEYIRLPSHKLS